MVQLVSSVTGHKANSIRPRMGEKVEVLKYDPILGDMAVYFEGKKIHSCKH